MLFHVKHSFGSVETITDANAKDYMAALKELIAGNLPGFNTSPAIDPTLSFNVYGDVPKKPYTWICSQTNPTIKGSKTTGIRHWFKKEHPLYPGHFLYFAIGLSRFSSTYYAFQFAMAEKVSDDGSVIINESASVVIDVGNGGYWTSNTGQWGYSGYTNNSNHPTIHPKYKSGGHTFFIGDWGLGIFGQSSNADRTPSFGNYTGMLFLETLADDLTSDNAQAFIPKNYPMALIVYSTGVQYFANNANNPYTIDAQPRQFSLMRFPKLEGAAALDLQKTGTYFHSLAASVDSTEGINRNVLGCDANGEDKAQVFPVYLNMGNAMVAKLPVLKPIIGSNKYTHVGKVIQSEGNNYFGIFALDRPCGCYSSSLNNSYFQALREKSVNQEYLRMD
ncbi:hypothetical protein KFS98_003676 [Salmonella enterica]|nr:hypothetical protein [Salmonella enterica]